MTLIDHTLAHVSLTAPIIVVLMTPKGLRGFKILRTPKPSILDEQRNIFKNQLPPFLSPHSTSVSFKVPVDNHVISRHVVCTTLAIKCT